jgi:hypothetical protein
MKGVNQVSPETRTEIPPGLPVRSADSQAVEIILQSLAKGSSEDRLLAIGFGQKLCSDNPDFLQVLCRNALMGDGRHRADFDLWAGVRERALEVLFTHRNLPREGLRAVAVNLKHPKSYMRRRCAETIARQIAPATLAWPYLIAQLSDEDVDVRVSVVEALEAINFMKEETLQALLCSAQAEVAALRAALLIDREKAHRQGIGQSLDRYLRAVCTAIPKLQGNSASAVAFLGQHCRSDCTAVRSAAQNALLALGFVKIASELSDAATAAEAIFSGGNTR